MKKSEVVDLVKKVDAFYPGRLKTDDPAFVVETWHEVLKDSDYRKSKQKLINHVKNNKFPPSVSDLITSGFQKTREQIEHEKMLEEEGYFK